MSPEFDAVTVSAVRENLERVRERIAAAGADPDVVEVLAATKYVPVDRLPVLAEAGITLVGENRAERLVAAQDAYGHLFTWDFIGVLQSRRVATVAPRARLIHSLASESAARRLDGYHDLEVLVQVNVAGEEGKAGIAPAELLQFLAVVPARVTGLMTMPPVARRPDDSRRHFAALAELAAGHGLERLSMGTSQDFDVAAAEGATIVRVGAVLYA